MIRQDTRPGTQIYFLDDANHVRSGELLRILGGVAAIAAGQAFTRQPTVRCFANEADALERRAHNLNADIAIRQEALATTLKQLADLADAEVLELGDVCCGPCCWPRAAAGRNANA